MFANAVMFGAFIELCAPQVAQDLIKETLKYFLGGKKETFIPLNQLALTKGREFVRANPVPEIKAQWPFHCIPSWAAQ
jgi:Pyruvate/2-oxoacid:ferredoxin oxidoreductase gamma subunit